MTRNQIIIAVIGMALFALVPPIATALDQPFYVDVFARILILAIAALSLDFILGYGGMVSFGHAAYIGVGAYTVGILSFYGVTSGFIHFPAAIAVSAFVALIFGAISLRTSGVYFIMITLAFAQMLFFLGISLEEYGGDDGMPIDKSEFAGLIDLWDSNTLYYFIFAIMAAMLFFGHRMIHSRFGIVIRGARSNSTRMQAVGFPVYPYRLVAFVISGTMCGVAGALFANLIEFASPDYVHWTRSGELLIMVVIGGMGTLFGPVIGATAFLLLEEYLPQALNLIDKDWGERWMVVFGPLLILIVLFARGGLIAPLERLVARIVPERSSEAAGDG